MEQTVKNPQDVPDDKTLKAGVRGGMYYDDAEGGGKSPSNPKGKLLSNNAGGKGGVPPSFHVEGPGLEVLIFPDKKGLTFKYTGPYGEMFVDDLMEALGENRVGRAISLVCQDYNARIVE